MTSISTIAFGNARMIKNTELLVVGMCMGCSFLMCVSFESFVKSSTVHVKVAQENTTVRKAKDGSPRGSDILII